MTDNFYKYVSRQELYTAILSNPGSDDNHAIILELNARAKERRRNMQKIRQKQTDKHR